ncbi:hypothetical protein ABK040_000091 [Willaertia magna]
MSKEKSSNNKNAQISLTTLRFDDNSSSGEDEDFSNNSNISVNSSTTSTTTSTSTPIVITTNITNNNNSRSSSPTIHLKNSPSSPSLPTHMHNIASNNKKQRSQTSAISPTVSVLKHHKTYHSSNSSTEFEEDNNSTNTNTEQDNRFYMRKCVSTSEIANSRNKFTNRNKFPLLLPTVPSNINPSSSTHENSLVALFDAWEEQFNGSITNSYIPSNHHHNSSNNVHSVHSNSNADILTKEPSTKTRKFTTFLTKLFGPKSNSPTSPPSSPTKENSSTKRKGSSSSTHKRKESSSSSDNQIPTTTTFEEEDILASFSYNRNNETNVNDEQEEEIDMETKQNTLFNSWFQTTLATHSHLFEKEGVVFFLKDSLKPNLHFFEESNEENNENDTSHNNEELECDFVARYISCKNQLFTIYEKATKESNIKYSFNFNHSVTYSPVTTERNFDTIQVKHQKKKMKLTRGDYFLFELRIENNDITDPLILIGCLLDKQERNDWLELFEVYSIYNSLSLFSDSLDNILTCEDQFRDDLRQEYELFDEYQQELKEQNEKNEEIFNDNQLIINELDNNTIISPEMEKKLKILQEMPPFDSKVFQSEMEKVYLNLLSQFDDLSL